MINFSLSCQSVALFTATLFILTGHADAVRKLVLRHASFNSSVAKISWKGLSLDSIKYCEVFKSINGSTEVKMIRYYPQNYTLTIPKLQPCTRYGIYLSCYDLDSSVYRSDQFNFNTTGFSIFKDKTQEVDNPLITTTKAPIKTTALYEGPSISPISRTRFTPERPPMEIGLAVAFSLIALGVLGVVAYYVIMEYRRRLRIRRFVQYRRHENEPFPDLAPDMDEEPVETGIGL